MTVQVFVTVGTSAVTNNPDLMGKMSLEALKKELKKEEYYDSLKAKLIKRIGGNLKRYSGPEDTKDFRYYTAELGSLLAMKRTEGMLEQGEKADDNEFFLLHTDTDDGKLCAEVLEEVIKTSYGPAKLTVNVKSIKTEFLNLDDSEGFKKGLLKLQETVEIHCKNSDKKDTRRYFNVTGGYKAIIPYATILAWNKDMDVCYLYEQSTDLIIIPKIAVDCFPSYEKIVEESKISRKQKRIRTLDD
ncbi:putative CRISPR-associated protein [Desulfobacca acetoxidans]|uniref:CRISPR-associated protein, APE2256 family n=1 Tax=Desulfobacca acetoxidans (strain ATCC 700848 / DSM 11109 / ASRB2) TaxID=880072 RepID=F2NE30_DESAR|nr:putative CRISPR-associated protein [Desulfobacca acetoxidans]AEB10598.1 CRISPR-associated protein, APE2256 family [Desulfobacca acetoxidans DSM 11109]